MNYYFVLKIIGDRDTGRSKESQSIKLDNCLIQKFLRFLKTNLSDRFISQKREIGFHKRFILFHGFV